MYQARPYGRFYKGKGDGLSDEDNSAAELLMRRLTNLKGASKLDAMKMARTLPSGAVAVAVDAGGTLRLLIYPKEHAADISEDGIATDEIPMLFCGVVVSGLLKGEDKKIQLNVTETTTRRLTNYKTGKKAAKTQSLKKFAVKVPPHLKIFEANSAFPERMTQYFRVRPTWWSGPMTEVVQIVGGYGKQVSDELPEDEDEIERASIILPAKVLMKAKLEMINKRLPGYTGKPIDNGEFQYDFKCASTDGVTFDSTGSPWLVQVSKRGVYAMPLPIIPITRTKAFKAYMEEVNDDEILWALERFGALPSGETFPVDPKGFEAWRRAGVIIKVCDTADFYDHDEMSLACGWSFNTKGTEGFNTATGFDSSMGIPYCAAYKLKLDLGSVKDAGLLGLQKEYGPENQGKINAYLSSLLRAIKNDGHKMRSIRYKIRRVSVAVILGKANAGLGENDVDYWDSLELEPIASHKGSVTRVGKGYIYTKMLPNFKLPNPLFEGCVSHSMIGLYDVKPPAKYPRCDTIIYGYYIEDSLKVVKYFRDDRELDKEVEDGFEDCMTDGEWTRKEYLSPAKIAGNIYTTDFDDREEVSESYKLTHIKGVDLGYPSKPEITQMFSVFSMAFRLNRRRYFGRTTNEKKVFDKLKKMYCYVPFMTRNALIYGVAEYLGVTQEKESAVRLYHQDPNQYWGWSYDEGARWYGWESWMKSPIPGNTAPPNPFWVEYGEYLNTLCSEWADDGPWMPDLPMDITNVFNTGPTWHEEYYEVIGGGIKYTPKRPGFHEYSINITPKRDEKFENHISIVSTPRKLSDKEVGYQYFDISPDEHNNYFYHDAVSNAAGSAQYASISDPAGVKTDKRTRFGFTALTDDKQPHHFIGVINE